MTEADWKTLLDAAHLHSDKLEQELGSLRESRDKLLSIIDLIPVPFFVKDAKSRFILMNRSCEEQLGVPFAKLRDTNGSTHLPPDQIAQILASDRLTFEGHKVAEFEEVIWSTARKSNRIGHTFKQPMYDSHGDPLYLVCITLDVTARKQMEKDLRASEARYRFLVEQAPEAIVVYDVDQERFVDSNKNADILFGCDRSELLRLGPQNFYPPDQPDGRPVGITFQEHNRRALEEGIIYERRIHNAKGRDLICEVRLGRLPTADGRLLRASFIDVTERKHAEEELKRLASHDLLTNLVNRGVFVEELNLAIARARHGIGKYAVLYLDLDHFKDINDTLGHPIGDLLLQAVAERIRGIIRETDIVARFGGDEFAVIGSEIGEPREAAIFAEKLLQAIGEPFVIQNNHVQSGASIGVAVFGRDAPDAETLLSHADVALYRAKAEGRGTYRFFTEAMDMEVRHRVSIAQQLREAIAASQLFLMYQPQVDVENGRIIGIEALVRWSHPSRGVLMPGSFIPIAEQTGLVVAVGHWVLQKACRQMAEWVKQGIGPPQLSVNVSGLQFRNAQELELDIATTLAACALAPNRLELELTESVLMEASLEHNDVLVRLRESGIHIAIDDFGNGYSSLDYLSRFPIDRIKIAQNFITDLPIKSRNAMIVKAATQLAHELGLLVVVEGVETTAELELIRSWGCRQVQGFYFSKPLSVADMTTILHAGKIIPGRAGVSSLAALA